MGMNLEQLENSLRLAESEAQLWEQKIRAYHGHVSAEREAINLCASLLRDIKTHYEQIERAGAQTYRERIDRAAAQLLKSHKLHSDAEEALMQLQLARLKAQAAIMKATIEQSQRSVVVPGRTM